MDKYRYYISFDDESNYSEIFPSKHLQITGKWVEGTWIDRVECSDVLIGRLKNPTVYDTLETWFTTPANFKENIIIKIEKASVIKWRFVFGVKWGKIDLKKKTYSVSPETYDRYYTDVITYIDNIIDLTAGAAVGDFITYNNNANTTFSTSTNPGGLLNIRNIFSLHGTDWNLTGSTLTAISQILNSDDDEDGNPVTELYGVPQDYVTGDENLFIASKFLYSLGGDNPEMTYSEYFDLFKAFQIYYTIDANEKLRFEHVEYFIDYAIDNKVTIAIDDSYERFEYNTTELIYDEKVEFADDKEGDVDWDVATIKYDIPQNYPRTESIEHNFRQMYTNWDYFKVNQSEYADNTLTLVSCVPEEIRSLTSNANTASDLDKNGFNEVTNSNLIISSNDMVGDDNRSVSVTISVLTGFTNVHGAFYDRSTGARITNTGHIATGVNTTIYSFLPGANDAYFRINGSTIVTSVLSGYINTLSITEKRVARDVGAISGANKPAAPFAPGNILETWWQVYRPSNRGRLNGTSTYSTFTKSQYNLMRDGFRMYYPNDVNMRYAIDDGTRVGIIDTYKRDLNSDFVEFTLKYPEDE